MIMRSVPDWFKEKL